MKRKKRGSHFDLPEDEADIQVNPDQLDPEKEEDSSDRQIRKKKKRIPGWVYRVIIILAVAALGVIVWFNRDNLTPEKISLWIQERVVGLGIGDGYPYSIDNGQINIRNFYAKSQDAVFVSDSYFTVLNSTAKEVVSRQHSFGSPVLKAAGDRFLIYNLGGTGYQIESYAENIRKENTSNKILAADLAENGDYAFLTEGEGCYGELLVYDSKNEKKFRYRFAKYYPTSVALNASATKAIVTAVSAKDGGLVSVVYVLNLSQEGEVQPVAEYPENLLFDSLFYQDGSAVAIGDTGAVLLNTDGKAQNYDYQGAVLTSYTGADGLTAFCLSPYENATTGELLVLQSDGQKKLTKELQASPKSVSLFSNTVAVLNGSQVDFYSIAEGTQLSTVEAGSDSRAVQLIDESNAYILAMSEIRRLGLDSAK